MSFGTRFSWSQPGTSFHCLPAQNDRWGASQAGSVWLALEREIKNPAIANSESQVGMAEKEKKEKERDFRYRVAMPPPRST